MRSFTRVCAMIAIGSFVTWSGAKAQIRTPIATAPLTTSDTPAPAPYNAKAVATSPTTVAVSWDAAAGVRSYLVQRRRVDNASCCTSQSALLTTAGWQDGALESGVEYAYTITATYTDGRVGSAEVSALTPMPALPTVTLSRTARIASTGDLFRLSPCANRTSGGPAPSGILGTVQSPAGLSLQWNAGSTNYIVDRAPEGTTNWVLIGSTCGGPSPVTSGGAVMYSRDFVGGIQPGTRYIYRVTAIGSNGEVGWNTLHWTPPCGGSVSMNTLVEGSTVSLWGNWSGCPTSSTIRVQDPGRFRVTSSYGFVTEKSSDPKSYYVKVYGVPVGTHTFTVNAVWYVGGQSNPSSRQVTVAY